MSRMLTLIVVMGGVGLLLQLQVSSSSEHSCLELSPNEIISCNRLEDCKTACDVINKVSQESQPRSPCCVHHHRRANRSTSDVEMSEIEKDNFTFCTCCREQGECTKSCNSYKYLYEIEEEELISPAEMGCVVVSRDFDEAGYQFMYSAVAVCGKTGGGAGDDVHVS